MQLTTPSGPWFGPLTMCVSTYKIYIYICITFGGSATPWPWLKSLSPPKKKPRVYLAGQRCRRGLQWVPLCSGWRGGRRPPRCRTSPCRHHHSCTHARSACPCCSALGGRCRWSGWGGKRCSAHVVWSQSALLKSMPYCLRVENKWREELICRANTFSREGRLKKISPGHTSICLLSFFLWFLSVCH